MRRTNGEEYDGGVTPPEETTSDIPAPGTLVGDKYLLGEPIAYGGMGCVVRAKHVLLEHEVAIKFVLDRNSHAAKARLLREARAMRTLTSEHVAEIFDLGMHGEAPYIVMELLEGRDLRDVVEDEGPLAIPDAVDTLLEAAVAVAEAHAMGIVHRDLKPANLFRAATRQRELVKVLDFGISKVPESKIDNIHATSEDTVLGTPHFSSPEQLRNPSRIDARADVWALGVTLFFLLTGELPFEGETRQAIMAAIFADEPVPLSKLRPDAPPELEEAIAATLAKRPEERTPDIHELVVALRPFASKRGKAAAARVLEPVVSRLSSTGNEPRDKRLRARLDLAERATTEGGLSSTLVSKETKDETQGPPSSEAEEQPVIPMSRYRLLPWLAVAGLVGGVAVTRWLVAPAADVSPEREAASAEEPATTQPQPKEAETASVEPAAVTGRPLAADSSSASSGETAAPPTPAPPTLTKRPAPRPAVAPPPPAASSHASARPSTSASASPPPVDIDGLPIIR
jgi:eukaryotic-like serine/threonine-protein kinase